MWVIGCVAVLNLGEGFKPFRTSLDHIVYVPGDFPEVSFKEHIFVRSKLAHQGRGENNRKSITKDNTVYVRTFGRSADFGIVSYIEAYIPKQECRGQAFTYNSLGILETWRERYCAMEEVWGICVWPHIDSVKNLCVQQDPTNKDRLIWVRR